MSGLYKMKLNELMSIKPNIEVLRVAGGWVYMYTTINRSGTSISTVFVPFNNEFQNEGN